jgi:hypothetical protein
MLRGVLRCSETVARWEDCRLWDLIMPFAVDIGRSFRVWVLLFVKFIY